jgi:hypothetical protein
MSFSILAYLIGEVTVMQNPFTGFKAFENYGFSKLW